MLRTCSILAILTLTSLAALADTSGTTTLKGVSAYSLDTGAVVNTGGDIRWNGTMLTLQANVTAYNYGTSGAAGATQFDSLTLQTLMAIPSLQYTKAAMQAQLIMGDVFAVHTAGGNYSKVLVTANTGGALSLQFTTFTVAVVKPPVVTAVENAATNIPPGLPNAAIAQGALFVVKGTLLGPDSVVVASSFPLTTSIAGTSIQVTVGKTSVSAIMYYSLATQIAAILPSQTPVGAGTLTVTYNGQTSAASPVTVVANNIGMFTLNSSGSGDVVATLPSDNSVVSPTNAPAPGDVVTFWATGLGPVSFDETNPAQQADMASIPLKVYIGGHQANVLFRGRNACCTAVDTIYVTVPAGLTGCSNSVIMQIGNLVSNAASMPIGTNGRSCVPINPTQPGGGSTQGTISYGGFALERIVEIEPGIGTTPGTSIKMDLVGGTFAKATYSTSGQQGSQLDTNSYGSCTVRVSSAGSATPGTGSIKYLDAGQVTVTGPGISGTKTVPKSTLPGGILAYALQLDNTATTLAAGTYTFNGAGGPDVGAFTATYNAPAPLAWTNQSSLSTINRASGATVTWSGGDPAGYVTITGSSTYFGATAASNASVSFTCVARVSDGSFFIPPIVLLSLPPSTSRGNSTIIEPGTLSVASASPSAASFQASGIDFGGVSSASVYGGGSIYQ